MLDYATGSEFEDYLRALQVAGLTAPYPWSIRGFSPREIERFVVADTSGPWRLAAGRAAGHVNAGAVTSTATFNSAYPYGSNDGPVWAGRGLTASISAGIEAHFGPVSFRAAPLAFIAQNRPFALLDNGLTGIRRFANGSVPGNVDYPQRFGNRAYSLLDPGNSAARFDSRILTLGVSTANEWIGPATEYPFLLGNNAAGFPHIFVGTGEPLQLGLARVHARLAWGKLYQSDYSPVTGPARFTPPFTGTVRLATYGELVVLPRGMPGLEIGAARFFHVPFRAGEPSASFWKKPFRIVFLKNEYAQGDSAGADNQLASVFFRWVFPHSGLELFGERSYEDQFYDRRDLAEDPDHERAYMLGLQKILRRTSATLDVMRGELINYQLPTIARVRVEEQIYLHSNLPQGHTNRGQLLGASAGVRAAAASVLSWTRYAPGGSTSVVLRRIVRAERGDYVADGVVDPRGSDVLIATGVERMRFGKRADFGARVEAMQDFNRNFSRDVPNLNVQLTARLKSW